MTTKQEIIEAVEFRIREREIEGMKEQDFLAELLEYLRLSKDERARINEFENDPKIQKLIKESEKT